jgi:hypothetical protein
MRRGGGPLTDEYNALMKNNTWCLVPKPACFNVVTNKWIFRYKYNLDGLLSRYKANSSDIFVVPRTICS